MRRPLLGLVAVAACGWAWAACGGKVIGEGTTSSSGTSGSPTATITFPSPGNDTPPPTTAGPTPTKPPPPDPGGYSAQAWRGGLDHIDVFKADFATDTCVHFHLATPASSPGGQFSGIKTPSSWAVLNADRTPGASLCSREKRSNSLEYATEGKGFVTWPPTGGKVFPCWLDVDVTLVFPDGTIEVMTRDAVNVIGGC